MQMIFVALCLLSSFIILINYFVKMTKKALLLSIK